MNPRVSAVRHAATRLAEQRERVVPLRAGLARRDRAREAQRVRPVTTTQRKNRNPPAAPPAAPPPTAVRGPPPVTYTPAHERAHT